MISACLQQLNLYKKYKKHNTLKFFYIWFASKKAAEAATEMGDELIGMVKSNTKGFCKETIEKLTKDWPGSPG